MHAHTTCKIWSLDGATEFVQCREILPRGEYYMFSWKRIPEHLWSNPDATTDWLTQCHSHNAPERILIPHFSFFCILSPSSTPASCIYLHRLSSVSWNLGWPLACLPRTMSSIAFFHAHLFLSLCDAAQGKVLSLWEWCWFKLHYLSQLPKPIFCCWLSTYGHSVSITWFLGCCTFSSHCLLSSSFPTIETPWTVCHRWTVPSQLCYSLWDVEIFYVTGEIGAPMRWLEPRLRGGGWSHSASSMSWCDTC